LAASPTARTHKPGIRAATGAAQFRPRRSSRHLHSYSGVPERRGRRRHGVGALPPAQLDVAGGALCVAGSFGLAAAPPRCEPYDACHGASRSPT
jgi:hypothetical protein